MAGNLKLLVVVSYGDTHGSPARTGAGGAGPSSDLSFSAGEGLRKGLSTVSRSSSRVGRGSDSWAL